MLLRILIGSVLGDCADSPECGDTKFAIPGTEFHAIAEFESRGTSLSIRTAPTEQSIYWRSSAFRILQDALRAMPSERNGLAAPGPHRSIEAD